MNADLPNEPEPILPETIWDDLASSDVLIDYLRHFADSNINTNSELRARIFDSLYSYSTEIIPEVEEYYCRKYIEILNKFNEKAKKCRNQKQLAPN